MPINYYDFFIYNKIKIMSRSYRKTKIFSNCNSSEKNSKRINNRMFRRKENMINEEIKKDMPQGELTCIFEYVIGNYSEHFITELKYPINMNEVRPVWSMNKDGKSWWLLATKRDMSK